MKNLSLATICCILCLCIHAQTPQLVVPTGHAAPISALANSPDGKYVLTGSEDGIAILWNREGDQLTSFFDLSVWKRKGLFSNMYTGDESILGVASLLILPDERMVTGGKSGKLIFWKPDGTLEKEIEKHKKSVNTMILAPDGKHFAAGDDDGNILLWNFNGEIVWEKKNAHNKVASLVFSPDGKELYSGGNDRTIEVWNSEDGSNLRTFSKVKGQGRVLDLAISPDGEFVIAGNLPRGYIEGEKPDRSAFIFDNQGKMVRALNEHKGCPLSVAFMPKSGLPIIGTSKGEIFLYPAQGNPIITQANVGEVSQLSANEELIIAAGSDGKAARIHPQQKQIVNEYGGLIGQFDGFGLSKKGKLELMWYDPSGKGGIFDLSDRNIETITDVHEKITDSKLRGLYWGPSELQEHELEYSGLTRTVDRRNKRNGEIEKSDDVFEHEKRFLRTLSDDASRALVAVNFRSDNEKTNSLDALEALVDMDAGRRKMVCGIHLNYETGQITHIRGHGKMILSADFSSDNQKMITGSRDQTAIIWDAELNKTVLDGHEGEVTAVAFSPDGAFTVTAGQDQQLFIRDGEGRIQHSFKDIGFIPNQAVFSADSRFLFLNDEKSIVHVYDAAAGTKLGRLFLFKGEDWAFVGDEGLFDATPGAMSKMYYVIHGAEGWEKLELDQLKARFFEPNIMAKRLELSLERARSAEGMTNVPLFPELSANIEADQLSVQLKARSGGIGPVSLFINGKEVKQDANPDRKSSFSLDLKPLQKYLNRQEGSKNVLALRAYNKAGWLKSSAYNLDYKPNVWTETPKPSNTSSPSGNLDDDTPLMFIVSIGTSDYTGEQLDLSFADQDAKAMAVALQSVSSQLFNAPSQVQTYCLNTDNTTEAAVADKGISWKFAEKDNIKAVFSEISQKASSKDIVLVYLSGHGVTYGNAEKTKFHYLTRGVSSEDLSDKAIRDNYTISDEELTNWINEIPALKQVLVIDACNSGKVVEKLTGGSKNLNSGQILALDRMKDRTGMFVISGSAADKVSYESSEFGQGLLTYSLLQGMNGVAVRKTSKGDFIDVMNLFQYARDEVPELAASISGIQTPMLGFPDQGASFDIGIFNQQVSIPIANQKPVFIQSNFQNEEKFEDDLDLSSMIDNRLMEEAGKGADADLVFMDLNKREGSYSIKGRYTVKGGVITVNVRLFSPDGSSEPLEIEAGTDAEKISRLIYREAKKAIR